MRSGYSLGFATTTLFLIVLWGTTAQPVLPLPQASQKIAVSDEGKPVRGDYVHTQARTLTGFAAPYVSEYATQNGIDLEHVGRALFSKRYPQPSDNGAVLISSYRYKTGDWTFFRSATVVVYDLLKVRASDSDALLLALYNRETPAEVILDRFVAEWRLALLNGDCAVMSDVPFTTRIKHREKGLWDMIYTDLRIDNGAPLVRILYIHSGGGGGRDQEFTAWFVVQGKPPHLSLLRAQQTLDEYQP